jgi:hypothetical protein
MRHAGSRQALPSCRSCYESHRHLKRAERQEGGEPIQTSIYNRMRGASYMPLSALPPLALLALIGIIALMRVPGRRVSDAALYLLPDRGQRFRQFSQSQSGPTFKLVSPVRGHTSILCASDAGSFPWRNSFNYDSDSAQYTPDFFLHALGFGFQEFLQPFKFGD